MPDLLRPLKIGDVTLPNNLVLSPMAGFSDLPFRVLARRHGAGLVCSEMVSSASVERKVAGTLQRMRTVEVERPTSVQLFGTDPASVARAAVDVEKTCEILGFNMGCPAHQIKRQGCGAALLDHPDLAISLVEAVKGASDKPLLVKIRAGNDSWMDTVSFAKRLEAAGADGIIFHARTAKMGYSGRSDWDLIARVKQAVSIPLVGNGDITDGPSAERALRASGADGVAIGRASLGDPRIFARIARWLAIGEKVDAPSPEERLADFTEYALAAEAIGLDPAQIQAQAQQFTRGLRGGSRLRTMLGKKGATPQDAIRAWEAHVAWLAEAGAGRAEAEA